MAVTSTPSHDDAVNFLITPAMLEAAFPAEIRRIEEADRYAAFSYPLHLDEDDLLLDCFVAAAGQFVGEDLFQDAQLFIIVDLNKNTFEWRVQGPMIEESIRRTYRQPSETANAIRFLEHYLELGIQLPLNAVTLSDTIGVAQGQIAVNGQPMSVIYPAHATPISIDQDPDNGSMGLLKYRNSIGAVLSERVDSLVLQAK